MTSFWWSVILSYQHQDAIWRHFSRACTKDAFLEHLNIIGTFEYNSKFKYKRSNLRLKHYLHYKVRWKGTNKSYRTCYYFGLRIPHMRSFLWLYKKIHRNLFYRGFVDFNQVPPLPLPPHLLIYHHRESRKMCGPTYLPT